MLKWVFGKRRDENKNGAKAPAYEEAREIAESGSVEDRKRLAENSQLQPEFLYFFATDKSPEVRRAVANNDGTPIQADVLLARDPDEYVKIDLSRKICRLLPTLAPDQNRKLAELVFEVVDVLSQDSLPRVRGMISEQVRLLDNIPPRIVRRLARDADAIVSAPVLEYSPLLTDEDLMEIVVLGCESNALSALARRKNLSSKVSLAVAETEDEQAVPMLLTNASADLNDETLSAIVDAAENHPGWHMTLAERRGLGLTLVRNMARYIGQTALDRLIASNRHIDDVVANELRTAIAARIAEQETVDEAKQLADQQDADREKARQLHERGELTAAVLTKAAGQEEKEFLVQATALLSGSDPVDTRRLFNSKDPKLAISIAWRCKLGMKFAEKVQADIMKLPSESQVKADGGSYPINEDDMAWSLEMLGIV
ncbi:MAG: DUF2336 domain-containing protein [Alphaproteobacteria bacterium]